MENVVRMDGAYNRITVHVPKVETKRFKAIVKALGFDIEKKNALDEAMDDIEAGRVYEVKSLNDLKEHFA